MAMDNQSIGSKIVVPAWNEWEDANENAHGFIKKWLHQESNALFALRRVGAGYYLTVFPSGDRKTFDSICPLMEGDDNRLAAAVIKTITQDLTGPVCGGPEDPNAQKAMELGEEVRGCMGTRIYIGFKGEGPCYRCKSKGYVNKADIERNRKRDAKARSGSGQRVDLGDTTI